MNDILTIDRFNKMTGQVTLHPLVTLADLADDAPAEVLRMPCDFYALICRRSCGHTGAVSRCSLRLVNPGEILELPTAACRRTCGYGGVLFHPDLLCDTSLEQEITDYPCRCRCSGELTEKESETIFGCLREIRRELHHAIDRYSSTIIVSHIELLLNYCTRFCSD